MTDQTTETNEEKVETIGELLKQVRTKKGISLAKVSEDLRIRKVYLKAIEDSNTKDLPPVPYGVGFVRSYATYLGLNVDRVVQVYKAESGHQDERSDAFSSRREITYPTKRYILAGVVAALFVYLSSALFFGLKNNNNKVENFIIEGGEIVAMEDVVDEPEKIAEEQVNPEPAEEILQEAAEIAPEAEEKPAEPEQKPEETEEKAAEPASNVSAQQEEEPQIKFKEEAFVDETPKTIAPRDGVRVVIKVKGETWLEVKDADQIYVRGIMNKGFEYEVPNKPGIILSIGRYYNADVYIDGKLTTVATEHKRTGISLDNYLPELAH